MFEASDTKDDASSRQSEKHASAHQKRPGRRKRRPWRVVLIALGSLLTLVIVAVIGSYAYVNHVVSSIPRLRVAHLVAATGAANRLDGQTFLITVIPWGPTGTTIETPSLSMNSNIVMLLHTNANGKGGGAVTIPGNVMVDVPGFGTEPLWDTIQQGGPSLMVQTVAQVTGVPINHYARLDFIHIGGLVNAVGGVQVTIPAATQGFGHIFVKGINHLTGVTAVYYARDPVLTDHDRLLRQENLVRVVITKIASEHLLTTPLTMVHVLNAITTMLAVDTNLNNSAVESLATQYRSLAADAATFVTAPTLTKGGNLVLNNTLDKQLWTSIKQDGVKAFAAKYPATVTPLAAP
jgi:LCP family protein required for cell wall assembly